MEIKYTPIAHNIFSLEDIILTLTHQKFEIQFSMINQQLKITISKEYVYNNQTKKHSIEKITSFNILKNIKKLIGLINFMCEKMISIILEKIK